MKLVLKNFRYHESKTFEFDETKGGLTLISGPSGQGKSTILNAILFVLYGVGKKLQTFGKTSCSVELEYKELKIIRTKSPNRLILIDKNIEYEDDIAQTIINKIFGSNFETVSYIQQNIINTFILKSPTEKLEFLEMFAFKDIDIINIKERCKTEIEQRKNELDNTLNLIEINTKIFEELKKPTEIIFPLKGKKPQEKLIKDEQTRHKNCEIRIKKTRSQINKIQKELNDLLVFKTYIDSKKDNINSITEKLKYLSIEEGKIDYKGDNSLNDYKNRLKTLLSNKELSLLEVKYLQDIQTLENMEKIEIEKYKKDLEKIKCTLWIEYTKEDAEITLKSLKDCLEDAKQVCILKKTISKYNISFEKIEENKIQLEKFRDELTYKKELLEKIKRQKKIYSCPSCHNKLHLVNDNLELSKTEIVKDEIDIENIKNEIVIIQTNIKHLEKIIPDEENQLKNLEEATEKLNKIVSDYEDDEELDEETLTENIEDLKNYYNTQITQENKKNEIENILLEEKFSCSYYSFKKDLNKLKLKISDLKENCVYNFEPLNEEELRILISVEQNNKDELERFNKKKQIFEEEQNEYTKKIENMKKDYLEKYEIIKDVASVKKELEELENGIVKEEIDKEIHSKNLEVVEKYNKYIEDNNKYLEFEDKILCLEIKEKEDRKKYNSSIFLKEKISEAESIAISNIIDSINNHAQIYLDYFFSDYPIIVKLLTFKETKKNSKPQINIEIDYKGNECDIGCLSGGELQRVILAFNLALSEMFNSPLLMLDECTSNLDQELTNSVFEAIKENFRDKFVLIVAHQVVLGLFDNIILI